MKYKIYRFSAFAVLAGMIVPVLLAGGSGTRLWPLSRKSYPKQFAPLLGAESLFQASVRRLTGPDFASPVAIAGDRYRFIVVQQLAEVDATPDAMLVEPEGRNTAPAALAAAVWLAKKDPEALMLLAPSDHAIPDAEAFRAAVRTGGEAAREGRIVVFGIAPTRPETGYGWLELSGTPAAGRPTNLKRFVEKPDSGRAREMQASGNFLWNAGLFLFQAKTILAAYEERAPYLVGPVTRAVKEGRPDLGFLRLAPEPWAEAKDISIDYAVMEGAENLSVVPFASGWSDLGDWDAVWREMDKNSAGVAASGGTTAIDCRDTLLRAEDPRLEVVGIGLENVAVVAMPDAVLVVEKSRAQEVRAAVEALKARSVTQAEQLPRDYRPWGWYESLVVGPSFQVKRIVVNPGGVLSLQSHERRSEHWIVVEGEARVTIDGESRLLAVNQSVYVPLGSVHRMENPGNEPMVLIEVQTGTYLGEDDITRYEDIYARD